METEGSKRLGSLRCRFGLTGDLTGQQQGLLIKQAECLTARAAWMHACMGERETGRGKEWFVLASPRNGIDRESHICMQQTVVSTS